MQALVSGGGYAGLVLHDQTRDRTLVLLLQSIDRLLLLGQMRFSLTVQCGLERGQLRCMLGPKLFERRLIFLVLRAQFRFAL